MALNPAPHKSPNEGVLSLARQLGDCLDREPRCKPILAASRFNPSRKTKGE